MNKKRTKKILIFSILVIFIISLIILLYFVSPEQIVDKIGVRNSYLLVIFVSFFGGFSSGGSVTFISLLATFAAGGMNPFYLALAAGISLAVGDIIMFYAGSKGRELIIGKWDNKIDKIANAIMKREWSKKAVPFLAYLYVGFAPLPNDILILFLAAIEYPHKKMYIILILGDITFASTITLLAAKGLMLF
ncbi:hypothetical protein HN481_00625 [Candidatus Parcubacteria bacterium]|jgi:hypothetical protein|nr:hypothetical protein [Candidatus Parcubacteria bacterium]